MFGTGSRYVMSVKRVRWLTLIIASIGLGFTLIGCRLYAAGEPTVVVPTRLAPIATDIATPRASIATEIPTQLMPFTTDITTRKGIPTFDHIFIVVEENHSYNQIIGSSSAPYLNSLAQQYGLSAQSKAVAHPSLPNYLALIGGDTFGITSDCTKCFVN